MPSAKEIEKPVAHRAVAKRTRLPAKGKSRRATVSLWDAALDGVKAPRLTKESGRLRVMAEVGVNGLDGRRPRTIPTVRLDPKKIGPEMATQDIKGHCPSGVPTTFTPKLAKPTHQLRPRKGKDLDLGGTIFGADDRYLFDDRAFPWRTTGKVRTAGKWGSGTTIGPRLVLTASHVVDWTGGTDRGVSWLTFTPAYFDGTGPWGEIAATQVVYWQQAAGQLTDDETAFDYVVLVMEEPIGDVVGYPGFRAYDDDWNGGKYWQCIGYPGELSSGERPAFQGDGVVSTVEEKSLSGQTGYVMGHFNDFTPGQSGGAVWGWWGDEPWPRVVGVGSTIGSTAVQEPTNSTRGDNEYGGGPALSALIAWARANFP